MSDGRKLKLLLLQNTIKPYRVPIFNGLAERCELTVAYSSDKSEVEKLEGVSFKILYIPEWSFFGKFSIQKRNLFSLARDFDAVLSIGNIAYLSFMALGANPFRKYGFTIWSLGVSASYIKKYDAQKNWDFLRKTIFNMADSIVFYTDYPKLKYEKMGIDPAKMFVANNTVAVADSVPSDLEKDSILFIGSLYPQKGLGTLLNAYKRVGAYKKLPRLDIIGAGSEFANVEKWIRENKLSDKIFLRGAVYDIDKKAEYFARAIACVSPCQAGLAVQESMGYGVCFATNSDSFTGGERFDIVHGQTGILFSENYGIGDFLAELADRPERFINIGKSAKNFYDRFRKPSNMVDGLWKAVEYAYNKRVIGAELK